MHFAHWLQHNPVIFWMATSVVIATAVELLHYFSMFLLVGPIVVVDLRLLGVAARRTPPAQLAGQLFPLMWTGLALNFLTGFLMFAFDATDFYDNWAFHIKLGVILAAVIFGIIVQWNVRGWGERPAAPAWGKIAAFVSLALWIGSILAAVEVPNLTGVG